uniref:AlNc14C126G6812 protein n=1 Tax=Albugo laibachii Nc14 TaxID=890382 RepID=F0WJU2_9STRA|nr:AlNc14C126G6812 [Albugo laibachii Nc14]|eukprot:CCA21544.1 AlNc14C126G6812 [Albugo laibachii Nc14]
MSRERKRSPGGQGRQNTKYSGANDIYAKMLDVINHLCQTNDMQRTLDGFYGQLTPEKRDTNHNLIYPWVKQRTHIEEMFRVITGASRKSTREKGTTMAISREGEVASKL